MLSIEVIEHCAPTLAGIKTGNIFTVKNGEYEITKEIRKLNRILVKKGLRMIPIRKNSRHTLIYLYRPGRLRLDLKLPEAVEILSEKGYNTDNPKRALVQLVGHLAVDEEFPHEIGLFLGYPSDVKCFMESPCNGVKCTGCWKVYSNQDDAQKTFERFQRCTEVYCRSAKKGRTLESLIVASDDSKQRRYAS